MSGEPLLHLQGKLIASSQKAPNIVVFFVWMAAVVAERRGGKSLDYISECAQFMVDVVGRPLSVSDPLPSDFDWSASAAVETAERLMEYDSD